MLSHLASTPFSVAQNLFPLIFVSKINNLRYVDYKTGKLKYAFLVFVEKTEHGAEGQKQCFAKALCSLYPDCSQITPKNIFAKIKEHKDKEIKKDYTTLDVIFEGMKLDLDLPTGFSDDEL